MALPPERRLVHVAPPAAAAIAALGTRLRHVHRAAARRHRHPPPPVAFLLVTPFGLTARHALGRRLREAGVVVRERHPLADRLLALAAPYVEHTSDARLARALAYDALWELLVPGGRAEIWRLAGRDDHARLARHKHAIRERLPEIAVRVRVGTLTWTARLHAFHLPDPGRVGWEASLLDAVAAGEAVAPHEASLRSPGT